MAAKTDLGSFVVVFGNDDITGIRDMRKACLIAKRLVLRGRAGENPKALIYRVEDGKRYYAGIWTRNLVLAGLEPNGLLDCAERGAWKCYRAKHGHSGRKVM